MQSAVFELPRLRNLLRHALPHVVEGTVAPLAVFYVALWGMGVWAALVAALVWSYGAVARRLMLRQRVPGLLVLGAVAMTVRTVVSLASGSVFLYFLQPTLGTVLVAAVFLGSALCGRPLAGKLAADFCPMPEAFAGHPRVQRFFQQISLLWGLVMLTNATVTFWLLVNQPVGTFVLAKTLVSTGLTAAAIGVSTLWFKRSMRRHGLMASRHGAVASVPAAA